ncbi:fibronectin type III domain-containing protein, partial [Streptomyces sp. NPDC058232]|uniref:fibronectin type III domain-containing protein n=1 Tax=Streptomyces sp. NPDC058232 TaxID=3346393 RepID=UPI0036E151CB
NVATTVSKTVNVTIPSGKHSLRVDFVNWTGAANVKFAYAPRTSATVDKVKPLVPTGTTVTYSTATTSTKVSWAKNKEMDLAGYRVYRRLKGTSYPAKPIATTTATSYTDTTVPKDGNVYYYEVRAYDKAGNASSGTADLGITTLDRTGPVDTALNARAHEDEAGVTLTWDPSERTSDDFDGYAVFRSTEPRGTAGSTRTEVGRWVMGTTFTDPAPPPGATYYYWVVALDHEGNAGTPSQDVVSTVAGNTTAPAPVTGLTAAPKENGIALSWDADTSPGFDHYRVLRGTFVDGQWTYRPLIDPYTLRPREIEATTFHHRVAADGQQVRYAVVAVDQYGNQLTPDTGAAAAEVTELDLRPTAPPATGAPIQLSIDSNGGIHWLLTNDENTDGSPVTSFTVRRWNRESGTFDILGTVLRGDATGWDWYDRPQPSATTVYYRVTALYADGTESGASERAVVTN